MTESINEKEIKNRVYDVFINSLSLVVVFGAWEVEIDREGVRGNFLGFVNKRILDRSLSYLFVKIY